MNMMVRAQVDPDFTTSQYAEHHSILSEEAQFNLWSAPVDHHNEFVKDVLMAELDGLRAATHISLIDDAMSESLYVFVLTYQSIKIDNIERLSSGLEEGLFHEVMEAHRLSNTERTDGCHPLPLYVLLERSYASLGSMRRLLESGGALERNKEILLSELISQERGLMDKAERLSDDLIYTLN